MLKRSEIMQNQLRLFDYTQLKCTFSGISVILYKIYRLDEGERKKIVYHPTTTILLSHNLCEKRGRCSMKEFFSCLLIS